MSRADRGCKNSTLDVEQSEDNFDACTCRVEQALSLILGEIKKIDAAIHRITNSSANKEFLPTIRERKEFNSVTEDSTREIINDLKKQRHEITKMQEFYNVCSKEFSKLEENQNRNREQIEQMRSSVDKILEFLASSDKERNVRSESINKKRREFKIRSENQEEIFKEIVEQISKLNEDRMKEVDNSRIAKLEAERAQDRGMLIGVVKQIHEVSQIKNFIEESRSSDSRTKGPDEKLRQCPNNGFCCGNFSYSQSPEIESQINQVEFRKLDAEKPKRQKEKRKNLFQKIFDKNKEQNPSPIFQNSSQILSNTEVNSRSNEIHGCQNPVFLGPYNSVPNCLPEKQIPFYLKLIGRKPERNRIKFIKVGDRYLSIE